VHVRCRGRSWRQQQETEEAQRFMAIEGVLMECEDGLLDLSANTATLRDGIGVEEKKTGHEAIQRGREIRRLDAKSKKPLDSFLARLPL